MDYNYEKVILIKAGLDYGKKDISSWEKFITYCSYGLKILNLSIIRELYYIYNNVIKDLEEGEKDSLNK